MKDTTVSGQTPCNALTLRVKLIRFKWFVLMKDDKAGDAVFNNISCHLCRALLIFRCLDYQFAALVGCVELVQHIRVCHFNLGLLRGFSLCELLKLLFVVRH